MTFTHSELETWSETRTFASYEKALQWTNSVAARMKARFDEWAIEGLDFVDTDDGVRLTVSVRVAGPKDEVEGLPEPA